MSSQAKHEQSALPEAGKYPKRILSLDDEPTILWSRQALLSSFGYEVISAEEGEQALHFFDSCAVDIVVLDYSMPGINGGEVARMVKLRNPTMPVIMVSAMAVPSEYLDSVDCVIGKGIGPELLLDKIKELLSLGAVLTQPQAIKGDSSAADGRAARDLGPNR